MPTTLDSPHCATACIPHVANVRRLQARISPTASAGDWEEGKRPVGDQWLAHGADGYALRLPACLAAGRVACSHYAFKPQRVAPVCTTKLTHARRATAGCKQDS